jgi:hypothetical protein
MLTPETPSEANRRWQEEQHIAGKLAEKAHALRLLIVMQLFPGLIVLFRSVATREAMVRDLQLASYFAAHSSLRVRWAYLLWPFPTDTVGSGMISKPRPLATRVPRSGSTGYQ